MGWAEPGGSGPKKPAEACASLATSAPPEPPSGRYCRLCGNRLSDPERPEDHAKDCPARKRTEKALLNRSLHASSLGHALYTRRMCTPRPTVKRSIDWQREGSLQSNRPRRTC